MLGPLANKGEGQDTSIEELIKSIRDLEVEMTELKREKSFVSPPRDFVRRCIWCDSTEHQRRDCEKYAEALRGGINAFKDGRIHLAKIGVPMNTDFGKGGMKQLLRGQVGAIAILQTQEQVT